ncbi:hypothetical protein [Nocardia sp. R7R-8]|uniref:hypothetical protein n=1 Tax=Nocardia sp. R7R-8 TaxID=3459304 RepID=UPI00403D9837
MDTTRASIVCVHNAALGGSAHHEADRYVHDNAAVFDGLDVVEPGLLSISHWQPRRDQVARLHLRRLSPQNVAGSGRPIDV